MKAGRCPKITFATWIITLVGVVCLGVSCARRGEHQSAGKGQRSSWQPVRPRSGVPIDITGSMAYFEKETARLLQEGKVATNLVQDVRLKTCKLSLATVAPSALPAGELVKNVEEAVVVVGQVVKMQKTAPRLLPAPA